MDCTFSKNGVCEISTTLAGMPVPIAPDACAACQRQDIPMSLNRVTCSKAHYTLRQANQPIPAHIQQCIASSANGIGTKFAQIVSSSRKYLSVIGCGFLLDKQQECGCDAVKASLNSCSCQDVDDKFNEIAHDINQRWLEKHPQFKLLRLATLAAAKRFLRLAVEATRAAQISNR